MHYSVCVDLLQYQPSDVVALHQRHRGHQICQSVLGPLKANLKPGYLSKCDDNIYNGACSHGQRTWTLQTVILVKKKIYFHQK